MICLVSGVPCTLGGSDGGSDPYRRACEVIRCHTEALNLAVGEAEVLGYLGPNGAGKTTTIRCLLGMIRASAGRAEIFGVDAQAHPAEAHRRVAYVPGEANLWPGLTGSESLHLLGRVQGRVDPAYRDELIARFQLDPSKRVRAYSKGNWQKVPADRRVEFAGRPAHRG
jgi:ABC-type multidrug transport system ATPase subunit